MLCRFENHLSGQALELLDFSQRITACTPSDLPAAFDAIEHAQQQGNWVALLLDYELGEWLEPTVSWPDAAANGHSRRINDNNDPCLTALVYKQARHSHPWDAPTTASQADLHAQAQIEKNQYLSNIEKIRASIGRGDLYQANYTFPIKVESSIRPLDLYKTIAARHPSAHAAYIEDGARIVLSFSPELFFERRGSTVTVRPMKGTAPRHADPEQDERSAQDLLHSEKNRAENLMIVDLLRNDLGRLATPGSVNVEALFSLERYPSVWALTSTISAHAPGKSLEDLLRALFPCGSITGAPKIAAMKKIRELEDARRRIYCGSVGWLAPNGDCSLNVAIRTIEMQPDGSGIFGVGGGIVHDSQPELEWQECLWKASILGSIE